MFEDILVTEIKKIDVFINKPVYSGLEISKVVMHEFWYGYVKLKYQDKAKLYYMDTGSFIVYIIPIQIYEDIIRDVETKFDISIYELENYYMEEEKHKVIRLMKDKLERE